jgi:hypothetical protein
VATLEAIRAHYPISLHGVGLSLCSAEGLDAAHLERVRQTAARIEPAVVSEHLSWSAVDGHHLSDLLPLPMTEEALDVVCRHVDQVQACLRRPILLENPSTDLRWRHSTIPEWEFLAAAAGRTGRDILCDLNNRLERAVNRALHAADAEPLDLSRLAGIATDHHGPISFVPHPSLGLVMADHPVDAIWRAVLAAGDAAMAAIDLAAGPVWLMVERNASGVEVLRMPEPEWRFLSELCASRPLPEAIDAAPGTDVASLLARHLAAGRFVDFDLNQPFN